MGLHDDRSRGVVLATRRLRSSRRLRSVDSFGCQGANSVHAIRRNGLAWCEGQCVGLADGEVLGEIVDFGAPGVGVPVGVPPGDTDPTGPDGDGDGPQMIVGSASYFVCR